MKKILWSLVLGLAVLNTAQAKDLKIGVISVDTIFKDAPQSAVINGKIQKMLDGSKAKLQKQRDEIQAAQDKFKKDELILSKSQKAETQQKILASVKTYRETEMKLKSEIDSARNQALAEFRFTVKSVLDKIAEEKNYDLILSDGVAYTKNKYDLTKEVIKRLKKQAKAKK